MTRLAPAGLDDVPAVSRILDQLGLGLGPEVVRRDWTTREGFDPEQDAWLARDGEEVVGFAACYPGGFGETAALDDGSYPSLLELVERRAIDRGDQTVSFLAEAGSPLSVALAGRSYTEEDSYFDLRLDLTCPRQPAPAGIDVRPAEGPDDERLVFELVTRCYADEPDFDRWRTWITMWTFDPELWLLGAIGGEEVGALVAWAFPDRGWIKRVALGRGSADLHVGVAVLGRAFEVLARRGMTIAGLPVGRHDPAYLSDLGDWFGMSVGKTMAVMTKPLGVSR